MANVYVDSYRLNGTYPTDFDNGSLIWDSGFDSVARVFQASASYDAYGVSVPVTRANTPGTITVELYAVDGSDKPTGAALATGTFDGDLQGTSTSITWADVTFASPYSLVSGTKYAIVMTDTSPDGTNAIAWWREFDPVGEEKSWTTTDSGATWDLLGTVPSPDALGFGVFTLQIIPGDKRVSRYIVSFCSNKVFYGPDPDNISELTAADGDIDCSKPLQATEYDGKVYVANWTNFKVADFSNVKITTAAIGANIPYHGDILTGVTSGAQMVVDYINATSGAVTIYGNRITTATFEAETVSGTNKNGDAVSFTGAAETSGPFWYDWTPYGNDTTNFGTMPNYAGGIELHIGKLWLFIDGQYPHQWYGTRQNNPYDFLYAQNDAGSAVAGNNTDAGETGDVILDAISYSDDYMIFGCANSLHVMLGNPCAGGRINLMRDSGLLATRAWCWDNDQNLYIVSTEGMLQIPKGFGPAANLTNGNYPDFIKDLAYNPGIHRLRLAYDHQNKGIIIHRVTISDGTNTGWFFDLRSGGLFPESYPEEASVFSMWNFLADDPDDSALIMGCNDGFLREFDPASKSDDAGTAGDEAIDAYVAFAPIPTSQSVRRYGRISNVNVVTGGDNDGSDDASDSDTLYCKVYTDPSAEKLIRDIVAGASPRYQRNLKAPGFQKGNVDRRKVRGRWAGLVIGNNTADESFAFEEVSFDIV